MSAASAPQRGLACPEVVARLREYAAGGRDDEIAASLRAATSVAGVSLPVGIAGSARWRRTPARVSFALPFAFPLLIVTGGRAPATVPGVLADVGRVREVLAASGVLGQARNFGLGNGLCSVAALESLPPSRLLCARPGRSRPACWTCRLPGSRSLRATSRCTCASCSVLSLTPAHAPSFLETGSAVATWGMALTRELSQQLRVEGLSVLPIPRPPVALLRAPELGRRAREELAYQAFVSRALRRFRAEIGEPDVTVAALDSAAVGVRFASALIEDRVDVHAWALHPLDDLQEVAASILGLLRECRVQNVQVLPGVGVCGGIQAFVSCVVRGRRQRCSYSSRKSCTSRSSCMRFFSMTTVCVPSPMTTRRLYAALVSSANSACAM